MMYLILAWILVGLALSIREILVEGWYGHNILIGRRSETRQQRMLWNALVPVDFVIAVLLAPIVVVITVFVHLWVAIAIWHTIHFRQ